MFNIKVERIGKDRVEIEVWEGETRVFQAEMPMKNIRDRSAVEAAFGNADSIFRNLVTDWIVKNTPVNP